MNLLRYSKYIFFASGIYLVVCAGLIGILGVRPSIDFTGGTLIEVEYEGVRPDKSAVEQALVEAAVESFSLRAIGELGYLVRARELSPAGHDSALAALSLDATAPLIEKRHTTIGPVIGEELSRKALVAIGIVILLIILYVAFAFRHVSKPVSSWVYGMIVIIALVHDILVPSAFFAVLGVVAGAEVDILFVTALLTILGYSVNDTIVIFDRVRENLRENEEKRIEESFSEIVGRSLSQTWVRSLYTSVTTLLAVLAIFIFGGEPTRAFTFTLAIGVVAGAYSSLFLAAPLLVYYERWQSRRPMAEQKL